MLEKNLEKKLRDAVREKGGIAYKFVSPGNSGVPDRLVLLPGGRLVFAEMKTERGDLTGLQKMQIARIKALGFDVRVVKGEKGLEEFLNEI